MSLETMRKKTGRDRSLGRQNVEKGFWKAESKVLSEASAIAGMLRALFDSLAMDCRSDCQLSVILSGMVPCKP